MPPEVLFEIQRLGNTAKATAIDAGSGLEAVVTAPATTTDRDLQLLALRKLRYLQGRELAPDAPAAPAPKGKGIIV